MALLQPPTGTATTTTITFAISTGETTDSYGQTVPALTASEVDVVLRRPTLTQRSILTELFPGVDAREILLTGRVVDVDTSYKFPDAIRAQGKLTGSCTYNGVAGRIECQIAGESPYGATSVIGERFYAKFKPL